MLKVIEQSIDRKDIVVEISRCGIIGTGLNSIIYRVKSPKSFDIVFDNNSIPTVGSMIADNYAVTSKISSFLLTGDVEFVDGIYEYDEYHLYNNSHNVIANANQNEITATGILYDFDTTDYIWAGNKVYTIDKVLSTPDVLVLTEPLEVNINSYKVVKLKDTGFFGLYRDFNNWLVEKINKITNCVNCQGKIIEMTKLLTYVLGLVHNIECQDVEGAKTIFNYLNKIQTDDNCC